MRFVVFCILILFPVLGFAQIGELVSPGELSKAHSKFSGIKNCNVCHGSDKNVLETKCLECHKLLRSRIEAGKGFHADKRTKCMTCHTEHLGRDFDIRQLNLKTFHHDQTGYKLEGFHAQVKDCSSCHKTRSFLGLSTACQTCHIDPHKKQLPACESCHSVTRPMKQITFDHSKTRFPLTGAHTKIPCLTCHKNQVFKGLPFDKCTSCHVDPHKPSLGTCTNCHTTSEWKKANFKHDKFPLTGKHASVPCAKCHPGGQFKLKAFAQCSDCHRDPHLGQFVQADPEEPKRFSRKTCEQCHNVNGFKPAKVDHSYFDLTLGHAIPCSNCHKLEKANFPTGSGNAVRFRPMKTDCVTCHLDPHQGQLGTKCENCHSIASFKGPNIDHSKTRFPLDENHQGVPCEKCHVKDTKTGAMKFKPLSTDCKSCHATAHMGQLGTDCVRCHTPDGLRFDHATAAFPLTGKHQQVPCEKCHKLEVGKFPLGEGQAIRYKPILKDCKTCHVDYHRGQFKKDCSSCHTTASFRPTTFSHEKSDFPLLGAHTTVPCEKCHKLEMFETPAPPMQLVRYQPLSQNCGTCHNDPHQGQFGKDCKRCHNEQGWKTISRGFHKKGQFPLRGRHLTVDCSSCHWGGVTKGTPTRCYDCHWIRRKDDLYQTRLGTDCERCHIENSWTSTKFNHAAETGQALGAAHSTLACDSCHQNKVFGGLNFNCINCHRDDYENANNPDHVRAGFPLQCQGCHSINDPNWDEASFNHATFPLRGVHQTLDCQSCHVNNVFRGTPRNCIGCHRQDYEATRNPDHRKAGFSTNCQQCHNFGDEDWDDADLDHTQFFRLVGVHATIPCQSCHVNNVFAGTPKNCIGCHKTDYQNANNPNHVAAGFSTDCQQCHKASDSSFDQGRFNHPQFPINSGFHAGFPCASCHTNPSNFRVFSCFSCHTKPDMDHEHRQVNGYVYNSIACYTCHPRGQED